MQPGTNTRRLSATDLAEMQKAEERQKRKLRGDEIHAEYECDVNRFMSQKLEKESRGEVLAQWFLYAIVGIVAIASLFVI